MPDDSPQPQPATPEDLMNKARSALMWLNVEFTPKAVDEVYEKMEAAFDRLLAEKARAEADADERLDKVMDDVFQRLNELVPPSTSSDEYNLGWAMMRGLARACVSRLAAATLAATAPAATETKEQENAR